MQLKECQLQLHITQIQLIRVFFGTNCIVDASIAQ